MSSYLQGWLKMAKVTETFDALFDLFMRDQFIQVCNRDLALYLKKRVPTNTHGMVVLVDQYQEPRLTNESNLTVMKGNGIPLTSKSSNRRGGLKVDR